MITTLLLATACGGAGERSVSDKARVMQKGGTVWGNDLARGLGLHTWDICKELGTIDCLGDAHLITMGGVEPKRLGVDKPLANALVTAPIAADRIAQSACGARLELDRTGPAVVFGPVLDKDSAANRKAVATSLIERLLSRRPKAEELDALESLHTELQPLSTDLVGDWSIAACLVVTTSTEALFY